MNVSTYLNSGLSSCPKHIPSWFAYDEVGCAFFNESLKKNEFYYFYKFEKSIIKEYVQEVAESAPRPCSVVDLGCGNAEKTCLFLDEYFKTETSLSYIPVDICEEQLTKTSTRLTQLYRNQLVIQSLAGEYHDAIPKLMEYHGRKLILWIGGAFQNSNYPKQIKLLSLISQNMKDDDRLLITIDMTQDKNTIEKAYLDPAGHHKKLYWNTLNRLNREIGTHIDMAKFVLEGEFITDDQDQKPGAMFIWLRSLTKQSFMIDSLKMNVELEEDEKIYLNEGGGVTYKYTEKQLHHLFQQSKVEVVKMWRNQHIGMILLKPSQN
ncbi:histidine N-alpha-methyltransferase-like isoform X2 [Mytilus californianus]|uniref:histidine N-alpha-methyltransferase-like isoform X2 n=1 Tax=Mytilus californianus TaxID=6549 RepID=UPI002245D4C0|nr:histidine N-alpha-methyltransferase-like isoform X2 [Mytilus californianus]